MTDQKIYNEYQSESVTNITAALIEAQKKFLPLKKSGENSFFKGAGGEPHRFSRLDDMFEACLAALTANNLFLIYQTCCTPEGVNVLTTTLHHTPSGEFFRSGSCLDLENKGSQGVGSAITYFRRYQLQALLNLEVDFEDDGNAASGIKHNKIESTYPSTTYNTFDKDGVGNGTYTTWKSYATAMQKELTKLAEHQPYDVATTNELTRIKVWAIEQLTGEHEKSQAVIKQRCDEFFKLLEDGQKRRNQNA